MTPARTFPPRAHRTDACVDWALHVGGRCVAANAVLAESVILPPGTDALRAPPGLDCGARSQWYGFLRCPNTARLLEPTSENAALRERKCFGRRPCKKKKVYTARIVGHVKNCNTYWTRVSNVVPLKQCNEAPPTPCCSRPNFAIRPVHLHRSRRNKGNDHA